MRVHKHIYNKSTQTAHTSLAKAADYPLIAQVPDLGSQHGDPNHPKNLLNCSWYHCTVILKLSYKFAHNLLINGQISDWTYEHGDPDHYQITLYSFYQPRPLHKISSFITFRQTNRETNQRYQNHKLLAEELIKNTKLTCRTESAPLKNLTVHSTIIIHKIYSRILPLYMA